MLTVTISVPLPGDVWADAARVAAVAPVVERARAELAAVTAGVTVTVGTTRTPAAVLSAVAPPPAEGVNDPTLNFGG